MARRRPPTVTAFVTTSDIGIPTETNVSPGWRTAIDVDPEMNRAIVYFDSLAGEDGDEEILAAFADHRIRLQGSIGRQVRAKKTPILSFRPDQAIRAAERIEAILHDEATMPVRPEPAADA